MSSRIVINQKDLIKKKTFHNADVSIPAPVISRAKFAMLKLRNLLEFLCVQYV